MLSEQFADSYKLEATIGREKKYFYEIKEGIAYITTLNRPEKLNAIDPPMRQQLWDSFQDVKNNPEVRCAIVTGAGRAFSTGHDLVAMASGNANEGPSTGDLYVVQSNIWKPIIAASTASAWLRVAASPWAATSASRPPRPSSVGPRPNGASHQSAVRRSCPRVVPRNIAFEFLFTGDFVDANKGPEIDAGQLRGGTGRGHAPAEEIARKITANAPLSIAAIKEAAIKGSEMGLEERVAFAQNKRNEVLESEDAKKASGPSPRSAPRCGKGLAATSLAVDATKPGQTRPKH